LASEPNKIFLGRNIGYDAFGEIVNKAGILTDREAFDVISI